MFILCETVGRTCQADMNTFPLQVRVDFFLSSHFMSRQQNTASSFKTTGRFTFALHSVYIGNTLAILQTKTDYIGTSVLQSYHGKATTTICIHLSQAPPSLESWAAVTSVAQRPCYGKKLCRFFNCVQVAACRSRMTVTSTCCMPCTTDRGLSSKPVESLVRDQNSTNVVSASLPASAANTISRMMTSKATKLKTVK